MIFDDTLEIADATTVALAAGTTVLGDVIDLGQVALQDIGNGDELFLVINVDTAILAATAGTIQFTVVSDALSTLGGGVVANCTTHAVSPSIATAAAAAGLARAGQTILVVALPYGSYEQYLGILVTVATAATTQGKVNAFLTRDAAKWVATADAIN